MTIEIDDYEIEAIYAAAVLDNKLGFSEGRPTFRRTREAVERFAQRHAEEVTRKVVERYGHKTPVYVTKEET